MADGVMVGAVVDTHSARQANRLKLLGIANNYLIGQIKFKLLFHGPLAE